MIRSAAAEGSVLLGFAANALCEDNRLIYAARITLKLDGRDYYSGNTYVERADCIYVFKKGAFTRRLKSKFHPDDEDLIHDLGKPPNYNRAWILLSKGFENFRYFGTGRPEDYKRENPHLKEEIESLTQGHRVNHSAGLREELELLEGRLFAARFISADTPVPARVCPKGCHDPAIEDDFTECS